MLGEGETRHSVVLGDGGTHHSVVLGEGGTHHSVVLGEGGTHRSVVLVLVLVGEEGVVGQLSWQVLLAQQTVRREGHNSHHLLLSEGGPEHYTVPWGWGRTRDTLQYPILGWMCCLKNSCKFLCLEPPMHIFQFIVNFLLGLKTGETFW